MERAASMNCVLRKWQLSDAKDLAAALNNERIFNNLRDGLTLGILIPIVLMVYLKKIPGQHQTFSGRLRSHASVCDGAGANRS